MKFAADLLKITRIFQIFVQFHPLLIEKRQEKMKKIIERLEEGEIFRGFERVWTDFPLAACLTPFASEFYPKFADSFVTFWTFFLLVRELLANGSLSDKHPIEPALDLDIFVVSNINF